MKPWCFKQTKDGVLTDLHVNNLFQGFKSKTINTTNHQSNLPIWEFRISVHSYQLHPKRPTQKTNHSGPRATWGDVRTKPCANNKTPSCRPNFTWKRGIGITGVIELPILGGNQTIQIYGDFEEFPLYQCSVWVGTIILMIPVSTQ